MLWYRQVRKDCGRCFLLQQVLIRRPDCELESRYFQREREPYEAIE